MRNIERYFDGICDSLIFPFSSNIILEILILLNQFVSQVNMYIEYGKSLC